MQPPLLFDALAARARTKDALQLSRSKVAAAEMMWSDIADHDQARIDRHRAAPGDDRSFVEDRVFAGALEGVLQIVVRVELHALQRSVRQIGEERLQHGVRLAAERLDDRRHLAGSGLAELLYFFEAVPRNRSFLDRAAPRKAGVFTVTRPSSMCTRAD